MYLLVSFCIIIFFILWYGSLATKSKLIYYFPLINIIFDILVMHLPKGEGLASIATLRGIFSAFLIFLLWVKFVKFKRFVFFILLYFFYLNISLFFFSNTMNDYVLGLGHILKINISIFLLPLAYFCVDNYFNLKKLNDVLINVAIIFIIYIVIVNIFGIGRNMYISEEGEYINLGVIRTGGLGGNSMNVLSYIILLFPIINATTVKNNKKLFNYIVLGTALIILLLVLRRSSIIIVFIGFLIYFFYQNRDNKKNIKYILMLLIIVYIFKPFYGKYITRELEIRGARKFEVDSFYEEARTIETTYIFNKVFSFKDIKYSLLGGGLNTSGIIPGLRSERPLHSDYTVILQRSGILGLILYILILYGIIKEYGSLKRKCYNPLLSSTFWVLIITSTLLAYTGRFTAISFRSIIFLYLGALLGIMKNYSRETKNRIYIN